MTTFKEISGQLIRTLSSDPTDPQIGQIWYNSTIGVLKGYVSVPDSFSSGGNLNTGRTQLSPAQNSTIDSGLVFGGYPLYSVLTEEYNGSTWTVGGNLNTGGYRKGGSGTQTAGLGFTGYVGGATTVTEEYNGSSWSGGGAFPTALRGAYGCGTQTATLSAGGNNPSGFNGWIDLVCKYNGSAWTTVTSLPTTKGNHGIVGTQTAALVFSGYTGPGTYTYTNTSYEYDGSSWTAGGNYLVSVAGATGAGTQTAALGASGYGSPGGFSTTAFKYDGSSWTSSSASLSSVRNQAASFGTDSSAIFVGGESPASPTLSSSEEFTAGYISTQTLTTS
jgi:hypothetical protein